MSSTEKSDSVFYRNKEWKQEKRPVDPLLDCLMLICRLNGQDFARDSLVAGLSLSDHCLDLIVFPKAAMRAGYQSRVVRKPLSKISSLLLPAIFVLKNSGACVVTKKTADGNYDVLFPESGGGISQLSEAELAEAYTGHAIFLKQVYNFEKRADELHIIPEGSWFWKTIFLFKKNYFQVMLAALFINLLTIAGTLYVMNVYDRVVPNEATTTLWVLTIGVVVIFIFDLILRTLRAHLLDVTGKQTDVLLASHVFQQVLNLRLENKPESIGTFSGYLTSYESLRDFFTSATIATLVDIPFILLFILIIWYIGGVIAVIPIIAACLIILVSVLCEVPARLAVRKGATAYNQKQAILIETVGQLETIKTQGAEGKTQKRWEQAVALLSKANLESRFFSGLALHISTYILQMVTVLVILVGVYQIFAGNLSLGGLIACSILCGRGLAPLTQIAVLITRYQQSKLSFKALDYIMKLPVERDKRKHFIHHREFFGKIECRNIDFQYHINKIATLNNINLIIQPGEHVGIIGRVGSGKSTLLKILAGLYLPINGELLYDDVDAHQIDPTELRKNYGYVPQDSPLLYGTVSENIATPAPWVSHKRILEVAQMTGVADFISQHPEGYDLLVNEQGAGISGGQRQTIAIARALVHDPKIIFMDEPTSNLDTRTEQDFIKKMDTVLRDKTFVIVTHKKNLLKLVNRVLVVDRGRIIIDGPRDKVFEVLEKNANSDNGGSADEINPR
ncbi:MAG: type I secretion system permease/ATPase [Legionellales bacterium]|nr:type I secretion system permease/ATPase [Legionellales bacterium]